MYKLSKKIIFGSENNEQFMLNVFSGDYYVIDNNYRKQIDLAISGKSANIEKKVLRQLIKNNIIYKENQVGFTENFHVQWHLTERCNLNCAHCYQENTITDEMSLYEMKRFVDHLAQVLFKQKMTGSISLTGGEPLILGDTLWELVDYIKSFDNLFRIFILTNGTLINDKIAKKFKKLNIGCQISFDGPTAEVHDIIRGKGNFNKALRGVNILKHHKTNSSAHFVIMNSNLKYTEEMIKFCSDNSITKLTYSRIVPLGNAKNTDSKLISPVILEKTYKNIIKTAQQFKNKVAVNTGRTLWCNIGTKIGGTCPAGFSTIVLCPNGDIYPCRRLPIVIGNIREKTIFEIWYNSIILKKLRNRKLIEQCGVCNNLNRCSGCRALAFAYFGDIMAPDPQCWKVFKKLPSK